MKNGKKPNKRQGMLIEEAGLNFKDWLIEREVPAYHDSNGKMVIVHRLTGETKEIDMV